jgi:hypothetical protein
MNDSMTNLIKKHHNSKLKLNMKSLKKESLKQKEKHEPFTTHVIKQPLW